MRLVEELEQTIGSKICNQYYDIKTDHIDFDLILNAIDTGGGQTCNIAGVIKELDKAGFRIVRK